MTSRVITQANHQKLIRTYWFYKIYSTDISAQKHVNTLSICLIEFTYSPIHQSRHNFVFFTNYCTGGHSRKLVSRAQTDDVASKQRSTTPGPIHWISYQEGYLPPAIYYQKFIKRCVVQNECLEHHCELCEYHACITYWTPEASERVLNGRVQVEIGPPCRLPHSENFMRMSTSDVKKTDYFWTSSCMRVRPRSLRLHNHLRHFIKSSVTMAIACFLLLVLASSAIAGRLLLISPVNALEDFVN
jgi:hypothetical protein